MPNSRCIETWARERVDRGTQVPVTTNRAKPGAPVDQCKYILMELGEMEASWRLRAVNTY